MYFIKAKNSSLSGWCYWSFRLWGSLGARAAACAAVLTPQCWAACTWVRLAWLLSWRGVTAVFFSLSCLSGKSIHWNDSLRSVTCSCKVVHISLLMISRHGVCLTISSLAQINLVEAFWGLMGFFCLLFERLAFWLTNFSLFRTLIRRVPWKIALNNEGVYKGWMYFRKFVVSSCKKHWRSLPGGVSAAFASCQLLKQQR